MRGHNMHAHEMHAHKMHAYKMHAHKMHAHKMHARKVHTHETPAQPIALVALWPKQWSIYVSTSEVQKTRFCASCRWSLLPSAYGHQTRSSYLIRWTHLCLLCSTAWGEESIISSTRNTLCNLLSIHTYSTFLPLTFVLVLLPNHRAATTPKKLRNRINRCISPTEHDTHIPRSLPSLLLLLLRKHLPKRFVIQHHSEPHARTGLNKQLHSLQNQSHRGFDLLVRYR